MSTFTDGAPPSVAPEPEDGPGPDRRFAEGDEQPGEQGESGSLWLREEIQRRIAAKSSGTSGRHARRGGSGISSTTGYVPRHSEATPGPGAPPPAPVGGGMTVMPPRPQPPAGFNGPVPPPPGWPDRTQRGRAAIESTAPAPPVGWSGPPQRVEPPPVVPSPLPPPVPPGQQPAANGRPQPAPPTGAAAARLLSPPPSTTNPPSTPIRPLTQLPPPTTPPPGEEPGAATTPMVAHPPKERVLWRARMTLPQEQAGETGAPPENGEVVWTARTPPTTRPARFALPTQRTGELEVVDAPPDRAQPVAAAPVEEDDPDAELRARRVRVVLAERKGVAKPVRTVVDIQEGTGVGELLRSNLIGSQLTVALRFAVGVALTLGVLPLLFALFPELGRVEVIGIRLPWLLLGVAVYPFLLGLGWWHTRTAERVEQNFADHVQD
ncbi:hypothetical protein WEH80_35415 [Actinomycetes bacterium KLBMP 9759]